MREAKFYYKNYNAPKPNKPNHIGACIIIKHDGKILLEKRKDSNRWALVGGGLKVDESLERCIIREVNEETSLKINENELKFFKIYSDPSRIAEYPDDNILRIITVCYFTEIDKKIDLICSKESEELKFFSFKELKSLNIAETHKNIILDWLEKN